MAVLTTVTSSLANRLPGRGRDSHREVTQAVRPVLVCSANSAPCRGHKLRRIRDSRLDSTCLPCVLRATLQSGPAAFDWRAEPISPPRLDRDCTVGQHFDRLGQMAGVRERTRECAHRRLCHWRTSTGRTRFCLAHPQLRCGPTGYRFNIPPPILAFKLADHSSPPSQSAKKASTASS